MKINSLGATQKDVEKLTSHDVSRVRDNVYRDRTYILPKLPKSILDVY